MTAGRSRREFFGAVGASVASVSLAGTTPALAAEGAARFQPAARAESSRPAKPAGDMPFQLGIASYTFRKFKLDETLAMTRRVGIQNICFKSFHLPLDASPSEIAATVAKVKQAGLNLYAGGVITMADEPQVNQAFEYAKAAGMRMIIGKPMPAILPLVEAAVKKHDIQVAIHNHGPGDKEYPTPQSAYDRIKGLDKRIGLCIDVGHTFRIGEDPVRSAQQYADRLLDMHIKDIAAPEPKGEETIVGRGAIDIPGLIRVLRKINYRGVVSFEYEIDPDDPLAGLAESVGYVRGVMASV